jgi:hypothetical protein
MFCPPHTQSCNRLTEVNMGCHLSKEQHTKPMTEPKKPDAQAPAPAVPTTGQLETTTPALVSSRVLDDAPPEPPSAMPPTEEQAAERPAQLEGLATLPEHLQLGVTLAGMRELLLKLPSDALEQVNAQIPLDKVTGEPKFPTNDTFNGYASQFFMNLWAKEPKEGQPEGDGLAVCERLQEQGSPHVGKATVFVSWFLATTIETLLDALANYLEQQGLREEDTFFWVCDYVIRQTNVGPDLKLLGECASAVGHTVLLMEPWHAPAPLKRAYCIKEVYYTQKSGARFDVFSGGRGAWPACCSG